jgi:predicted Holliday junction resolvase-like endonuclease
MMQDTQWFILLGGIGIGLLVGYLFAKIFFLSDIKRHRSSAVKQSQHTTLWYVHEKVAPLLPDFPYQYKDLMFLGKGVDYIVFDGLSSGQVREIVFLEIKSWASQLSSNEKRIKEAIDDKRVRFETLRMRYPTTSKS